MSVRKVAQLLAPAIFSIAIIVLYLVDYPHLESHSLLTSTTEPAIRGFFHVWINPKDPTSGLKAVTDQLQQLTERPCSMKESSIPLSVSILAAEKLTRETIASRFEGLRREGKCSPFVLGDTHFDSQGTELFTLKRLHQHCIDHPNGIVLYVHNKGALHETGSNARFRSALTDFVAGAKSQHCQRMVTEGGANTCGLRFSWVPHAHYSGNFWWAKCSYVSKLMVPVDLEMMYTMERDGFTEWMVGRNRWSAEHWLNAHPAVVPSECMAKTEFLAGHPERSSDLSETVHCRIRLDRETDLDWVDRSISNPTEAAKWKKATEFRTEEIRRWYGEDGSRLFNATAQREWEENDRAQVELDGWDVPGFMKPEFRGDVLPQPRGDDPLAPRET